MKTTERSSQACRACRRLKRRCTKELPSCSLCVRLSKDCRYPQKRMTPDPEELDRESLIDMVRQLGGRVEQNEQGLLVDQGASLGLPSSQNSSPIGLTSIIRCGLVDSPSFPSAFFLDPDLLAPIMQSHQPSGQAAPFEVMKLIGDDITSVTHAYFSNTHTWFPIISQKRLYQRADNTIDTSLALLILCMKLISESTDTTHPSDSTLYQSARQIAAALEDTSIISLSLLQSIVMIALYEVGHGVFPAAYLTVGRAARLGMMMGLHCRNAQRTTQLYKPADSWTLCEEGRRTWWAVLVLDRYLNLGPKGIPLATPEPNCGDLLPSDDTGWNLGEIGPNEPVYSSGFSKQARVGPFARTCQSAHMLGRVLKHRDSCDPDHTARLDEALQLHSALTALDVHLVQTNAVADPVTCSVDLALCCSARLALYNLYACNEPSGGAQERVAGESEMQTVALEGIRSIAAVQVPDLARGLLRSGDGEEGAEVGGPLVAQCLYHAATECQWFVREGMWPEMETSLQLATEALALMAGRWGVAGMYLRLLESSMV